jgi:hypothetical protein
MAAAEAAIATAVVDIPAAVDRGFGVAEIAHREMWGLW